MHLLSFESDDECCVSASDDTQRARFDRAFRIIRTVFMADNNNNNKYPTPPTTTTTTHPRPVPIANRSYVDIRPSEYQFSPTQTTLRNFPFFTITQDPASLVFRPQAHIDPRKEVGRQLDLPHCQRGGAPSSVTAVSSRGAVFVRASHTLKRVRLTGMNCSSCTSSGWGSGGNRRGEMSWFIDGAWSSSRGCVHRPQTTQLNAWG